AREHPGRVDGVVLLGVEAGGDALADGIPVLVIQGVRDEVTPPANGEALRASAPGLVSVVSVDGGGHLFPATHVGATSWAIEDYLDWD
ncbi:MAG: alpha/beta hydrolase, partial [Microbacterium sp.]